MSSASKYKEFVFISSVVNFSCNIPFEIIPGYVLDRADDRQIELIKESLLQPIPSLSLSFYKDNTTLYETSPVWDEKCEYPRLRRLPKEAWNYWIIKWDRELEDRQSELQFAFTVADCDIFLGAHFPGGLLDAQMRSWDKISTFYSRYHSIWKDPEEPQKVTSEDLGEVQRFYERIRDLDESYRHISVAVKELERLRGIPDHYLLKHLGYFAILELVLTHEPKHTDPTDSLTRQIRSKVALIANRTTKPLTLQEQFPGARFNTIIDKLYSYRSRIAHGVTPDFEGDPLCLYSSETLR